MRTRTHRLRHSLTTLLVATGLAAALSSCGGKRDPATTPDPEAEATRFSAIWPRDAIVPIEIQNRHTLDLTIYVTRSGKSQRVGMATAARSTYIRLPSHLLGPGNELVLMAHAIGAARRLQSERMVVMPGQKVVWTIDHGFDHASSAVW
jgi:hypothetical protein